MTSGARKVLKGGWGGLALEMSTPIAQAQAKWPEVARPKCIQSHQQPGANVRQTPDPEPDKHQTTQEAIYTCPVALACI